MSDSENESDNENCSISYDMEQLQCFECKKTNFKINLTNYERKYYCWDCMGEVKKLRYWNESKQKTIDDFHGYLRKAYERVAEKEKEIIILSDKIYITELEQKMKEKI
jgi:hypothetical protein